VSELSIQQEDNNDLVASFIARANVANIGCNTFLVDFGATHHMVNYPALLTNIQAIATRPITIGNEQTVLTSSTGTLQLLVRYLKSGAQ
jgi:hypothetical protein